MENSYNGYASTMSGPLVGPLDQGENVRGSNDVMIRRLKNRERQRRYRARKRLEADRKKVVDYNQPTPPPEQLQLQEQQPQLLGTASSCVNRVHSRRNWKRDARNAHCSITNFANGNQVASFGIHSRPLPESEIHGCTLSGTDNNETPRTTLSRRNWKAEVADVERSKMKTTKDEEKVIVY